VDGDWHSSARIDRNVVGCTAQSVNALIKANLCNGFVAAGGAMVFYSMTIIWPTIIGTVYSTDVLTVGWQSSVVGGGVLLGQVLVRFTLTYMPKVKYQTVIASCLAFAFVTSLSLIPQMHQAALIALGVCACAAMASWTTSPFQA
jgi:hypothetical protein